MSYEEHLNLEDFLAADDYEGAAKYLISIGLTDSNLRDGLMNDFGVKYNTDTIVDLKHYIRVINKINQIP